MPSSRMAMREIINLIRTTDGPIFELGSGWGILSIQIAKSFPQRKVTGYEISLLPYLFSKIVKAIFNANNLTIKRVDFLKESWSSNAVLVSYLFPEGMTKLGSKVDRSPFDALISNTFALPGRKADKIIRLNDIYCTPVYFYRF